MSLTWQDCTEIVCGKVILGEYSVNAVRPEIFFPPYNDVIKAVKNGVTDVETLIEMCGWNPIQTAIDATKELTSNGEINWIKLLESTYASYDAGHKLEKISKKLQKGEEVDWSIVDGIQRKALEGIGGDFVPLADVQSSEVPMVETGWKVIDDHIGGLPEVGLIVVGADPGVGKAQPLYSKILTIDGWLTMGEIKVGDVVIGGDGNPCEVLGVFPQGNRPIYRVWFDDKTYTDCDEEHLWSTQTRIDRRFNRKATPKTVKEIIQSGLFCEGKRKKHSIEFVQPINFSRKYLMIDPYLMGILISEGGFTQNSIHVTSGDGEIIDSIKNLLPIEDELVYISRYDYRIVKRNKKRSRPSSYTSTCLQEYKLHGLTSSEKFIPNEYLFSSIEDRILLLQGLLDGDGTVANNGYIEFSTVSEKLKVDFMELCWGLGARVTCIEREGSYTKNGKHIQGKHNYRIFAKFRKDIQPFLLKRKQDKLNEQCGRRHHKRFIEKIEFLGEFPAQCIYVNNDDHLYLTDNYIVTHNTTWMLQLCGCFANKHEDKQVGIFSPEMVVNEVAARSREINKLSKRAEKRILINDFPVTVEEIINKAASIENLGLLCIDYADLLVRGDNSESAYAHIYRTLMLGAKQLHCPIVLLAQLTKYGGGLPKPRHLRYTKMAEALAWMILMLYNPATDFNSDSNEQSKIDLPTTPNTAFILVWKIRGGYRKHLDEAPGAIQLPFRGDKGWHLEKSRWFSLKKSN